MADLLTRGSAPASIWTTTNVAEAMPGVITPLSWSLFGPVVEIGNRRAFHDVGALTSAESRIPGDELDWFVSVFPGRVAIRVDFICQVGGRMPGTSARASAEQLMSRPPDDLPTSPTRRRYPFVAVGVPRTIVFAPLALRRFRADVECRWAQRMPLIPAMDAHHARAELQASAHVFQDAMTHQCTVSLGVVQPMFDQLRALAGDELFSVLGGQGNHEETRMVADLWACSRGLIEEDTVIARHGYHGPMEGEVSGRVWREDRGPLRRLLARYAQRGAEADPARTHRELVRKRRAALERLLAGRRGPARLRARAVVAMADRYVPLRGVGKAAYLIALDLCRASARRIGELMVADGALDDPADVFCLTLPELSAAWPPDAREPVERRKAERGRHLRLDLPTHWIGTPVPVPVSVPGSVPPAEPGERPRMVQGTGVNAGVVEGVVRVVLDPVEAEIEEGEVLVARITDPGWAALMFLSSALVVDVGGTLSHTAVVSRELGIPCVVDTGNGSSVLRIGDRVRVDGATGTVELLTT